MTPRLTSAIIAATALTFAVTACGSSDDGSGASPEPTTTVVAADDGDALEEDTGVEIVEEVVIEEAIDEVVEAEEPVAPEVEQITGADQPSMANTMWGERLRAATVTSWPSVRTVR